MHCLEGLAVQLFHMKEILRLNGKSVRVGTLKHLLSASQDILSIFYINGFVIPGREKLTKICLTL